METIILAAGSGSRLGERELDLPKLFLDINGTTVFEYQINSLKPLSNSADIKPILNLVLGYGFYKHPKKQTRISKYVNIDDAFEYRIIEMENWEEVDNAKSALTAVEKIAGDDHLLLFCGDVITSSNQLGEVVNQFQNTLAPDGYSGVVAIEGIQNEMTAVLWDDDGTITNYGAIKGHQEAGIFILHKDHIDKALDMWRAAGDTAWFPVVFPKLPTKALTIDPKEHIEINNQEQLERATSRLPME